MTPPAFIGVIATDHILSSLLTLGSIGPVGIGSFVATATVAFRDVDGIHALFGLVSVEVRVRL